MTDSKCTYCGGFITVIVENQFRNEDGRMGTKYLIKCNECGWEHEDFYPRFRMAKCIVTGKSERMNDI